MRQIKVSNEKELQNALLSNYEQIILEGPKATTIIDKIEEAQRKSSDAKAVGIFAGIVALVAAPFTGGISLGGLCLTGASLALSEAVIIAIITGIVTLSTEAIDKLTEYKIAKLNSDKVLLSKQA